jgi:DNA-3-methyladenine glycosylase
VTSMSHLAPVPRSFYARDSRVVAPELLNKVLVVGSRRGRIVEVEAYVGAEDPASHAYRGPTARNASMFGAGGHLYVYFTYGMHWCANAVTGPPGIGQAVLLRALAPLAGLEEMRLARSAAHRDHELANGPAKLCQAMGIGPEHGGVDLTRRHAALPWIGDDGVARPVQPGVSRRVGISVAVDEPWRFFVAGDPNVSRLSTGARRTR